MLYNTVAAYCGIATLGLLAAVLRQTAIAATIIGAWAICPAVELKGQFKAQAFPIYLLHGVWMTGVLVAKNIAPEFTLSLGGYAIGVVAMIFGSIGTSMLLRKYSPRVATIVFGGR